MPASETTASAQHEPIVVHVQWDEATVWQYGLGGPALLVCVMLLWLAVQLRARDRVRSTHPVLSGRLFDDAEALEALAAKVSLNKERAKLNDKHAQVDKMLERSGAGRLIR